MQWLWLPEVMRAPEQDTDALRTRRRVRIWISPRGSAADKGKKMRRIPLTFDRDRSRSALDLCEVIGSQLDVGRAEILLEPVELGRAGDRHDPRP